MGCFYFASPLVLHVSGADEVRSCFGSDLLIPGDSQLPHVVPECRGDCVSSVYFIQPGETMACFAREEVFSLVDAGVCCFQHVELPCHCAVSGGFCWDLVWWEVPELFTLLLEECPCGGSEFPIVVYASSDGGCGYLEVFYHKGGDAHSMPESSIFEWIAALGVEMERLQHLSDMVAITLSSLAMSRGL